MSEASEYFKYAGYEEHSGAVPVNEDAMKKLLTTVENDLDALGWDQPIGIYVIAGKVEDPHLELVLNLDAGTHPCDALQRLYDMGLRISDKALGLVVASEGYRHLDVDELPGGVGKQIRDSCREFFPEYTDEEIEREVQKAYFNILRRAPGPASMPNELRREVRTVTAVFRDGSVAMIARTRDEEPGPAHVGAQASGGGNVPESMLSMLRGERPKYNTENRPPDFRG